MACFAASIVAPPIAKALAAFAAVARPIVVIIIVVIVMMIIIGIVIMLGDVASSIIAVPG